jgi:hypothetical protein
VYLPKTTNVSEGKREEFARKVSTKIKKIAKDITSSPDKLAAEVAKTMLDTGFEVLGGARKKGDGSSTEESEKIRQEGAQDEGPVCPSGKCQI